MDINFGWGHKICSCNSVAGKQTDVKLGGIIFVETTPAQMFCMKIYL
jgi:hypothetical protein